LAINPAGFGMLQISNLTPYAADRAIAIDPSGTQVWVVVIKATFELGEDNSVSPAAEDDQEPVCTAPEYFGEPGRSSLRRESKLVYAHPGTDIIVNASAYAPNGKPCPEVMVGVKVGPVRKLLRVLGERRWRWRFGKVVPSAPEVFTTMPIRYERAYGGTSPDARATPAMDARNPIGRGFHHRPEGVLDRPAPNLEDPDHPIKSAHPSSQPAGLGIIAPWWLPRRTFGGTYDAAWRKERMPFFPDDFDPRFFLWCITGTDHDRAPAWRRTRQADQPEPRRLPGLPAPPAQLCRRYPHQWSAGA